MLYNLISLLKKKKDINVEKKNRVLNVVLQFAHR